MNDMRAATRLPAAMHEAVNCRLLTSPPDEESGATAAPGGGGKPRGVVVEFGDASSKAAVQAKHAHYSAANDGDTMRLLGVEVSQSVGITSNCQGRIIFDSSQKGSGP